MSETGGPSGNGYQMRLRRLTRTTAPHGLVVQPDIYADRIKIYHGIAEEHAKLVGLFSSGSTFAVTRHENGQITINKVG